MAVIIIKNFAAGLFFWHNGVRKLQPFLQTGLFIELTCATKFLKKHFFRGEQSIFRHET